jgi:putative hemolysin
MQALAIAARPVVLLLSFSTDTVVRVLRVPRVKEPAVTVEEFKVLIEQGAEEGVLEKTEQELVGNVLRLDERRVSGIMTSRSDVFYLDIRESFDRNRVRLSEAPHSVIPLCEGGMEHVIGFVKSTDVLVHLLRGETIDLKGLATPALFVPATTTLMRLLEQFRRAHVPVALVIDEYGEVDGLVSLGDVVEAIVGDLPPEPGEDPMVTRRDDGSWLIDGRLDIDGLRRALESDRFGDEDQRQYHTAGGLAMAALERVPRIGDAFERDGFRFEIVDMDGNRVDRLLVTRVTGVQKR